MYTVWFHTELPEDNQLRCNCRRHGGRNCNRTPCLALLETPEYPNGRIQKRYCASCWTFCSREHLVPAPEDRSLGYGRFQ